MGHRQLMLKYWSRFELGIISNILLLREGKTGVNLPPDHPGGIALI